MIGLLVIVGIYVTVDLFERVVRAAERSRFCIRIYLDPPRAPRTRRRRA